MPPKKRNQQQGHASRPPKRKKTATNTPTTNKEGTSNQQNASDEEYVEEVESPPSDDGGGKPLSTRPYKNKKNERVYKYYPKVPDVLFEQLVKFSGAYPVVVNEKLAGRPVSTGLIYADVASRNFVCCHCLRGPMALRSIVSHDKCKEHQRLVTEMNVPMFEPLTYTKDAGMTVEFNNGKF
jgi:hypothetical protein